jgi:hypothetical protein
VLEEGDDVGERFVEGEHIRVARFGEIGVQPVQERVRGLVRDDVVREAGKDQAARQVRPGVLGDRWKIAEEQGLLLGAVVGVGLPQCVRVDAKLAHELVYDTHAWLVGSRRPQRAPAQRPLEVLDGRHGHRVNHLLVKLRRALRQWQSVLCQHERRVEVHRLVEAVAGRVVVDDLEVLALRSRFKLFPRHAQRG